MTRKTGRRGFLRVAVGGSIVAAGAGTSSAQGGQRHTVDMTDQLVFDPESLTIAPGDTIVWENVGAVGHSVTAYEEEIPGEAAYFASGGFESEDAARDAYSVGDPESGDVVGGESFEHTFDVAGSYDYFCIPHETVGMVASVDVTPGGASEQGGEPEPAVPDAAKSVGVVATGALLAVLGLAYIFVKYGGEYGLEGERRGE